MLIINNCDANKYYLICRTDDSEIKKSTEYQTLVSGFFILLKEHVVRCPSHTKYGEKKNKAARITQIPLVKRAIISHHKSLLTSWVLLLTSKDSFPPVN